MPLVILLNAERFPMRFADSFESSSVRLNIDDVEEMIGALNGLGWGTLSIRGNSGLRDEGGDGVPVVSVATAHLADVRVLNVTVGTHDQATDRDVYAHLTINPDSVSWQPSAVGTTGTASQQLREVSRDIKRMVTNARPGVVDAKRAAIGIDLLLWVLALGLGAWAAWSIGSWPAALFILVAVWFALRRYRVRRADFEHWVRRRPNRHWLDQKSRKELATERANRRANVRVAIWGAVAGAAVGALLTVILGAIFTRG
jgi:hypothetical protein